MYIWNLGTPFLFWIMGGGASIWDCELCVSMGGVLGEGEREREREREINDFLFIFRREFNNLMTQHYFFFNH